MKIRLFSERPVDARGDDGDAHERDSRPHRPRARLTLFERKMNLRI